MATFFKQFPTVDLKYANNDKNTIAYTDIYRFVDVDELNLESFTNYEWYEIEDGERPDHISQKLYETPNFYWTFFIINERLKGGYKEWPLSNSAFDKYLAEKYDQYGVCNIIPSFLLSQTDLMNGSIFSDLMDGYQNADLMLEYDSPIPTFNFIKGLDLTYPWLRVKRTISSLAQDNNQWAKIKHYDNDRYQLWLEDVTDSFFFNDINPNIEFSNQIEFVLMENPYDSGSAEYIQFEANEAAWIESSKVWYNTFFEVYTGDDFKGELLSKLKFVVRNFYETGSIATDYFIDGVTGKKLCNLFCNLTGEGVPIPYYESERTKNDEKRFIRTIRPGLIRRFADTYEKVLKSSGRLQL